LRSIHDEFNNEVSYLVNNFIDNKTEQNYNILRDLVFDYLNRIINNNTPVSSNLQSLGKQINSPRLLITDCNNSFIIDTFETAYNTFDSYSYINITYKLTHRLYIECAYVLLYGYYGCTKFSYTTQKDINIYCQSNGNNITQPTYYIYIICFNDLNNMLDDNMVKLELIKDVPNKDIRLKMIYDEFILQINYLLDSFINDKTDLNYNNLKMKVFDYLEKIKNCSTPITSILQRSNKQINSPRIIISDCYYVIILDTYENCNNTFYNYLNNMIYNTNSEHVLLPEYIRCTFYGSHSGTKTSYFIHKNINFYNQSYGPNLLEPLCYIDISCLADENVI
jgi:hypothetical protein